MEAAHLFPALGSNKQCVCVCSSVEGCFPRCPKNMVLDEVTRRCVYTEDCESVVVTMYIKSNLTFHTNETNCTH